jgi:DNA-binding CsgD family transcriptional regulator
VGYALLLLGEFACVHSATVFVQANPLIREQFDLFSILLLAAELVVFVLGACLWRVLDRRARQWFIGLACLLVTLGLVGVFLLGTRGDTPWQGVLWPLLGVSAVGLGLGFALYNLVWARVFSVLGARELYRQVIFSYLLGLLFYLLLTFMPAGAVIPLVIVALLGSAILLSLSLSTLGGRRTANAAATAGAAATAATAATMNTAKPSRASVGRAVRLLWRPVLCTAAFGFMSGLMSQVSAQGRLPLESFQQTSILASLVIVGILLLPVLFLSKPPDITAAYRIALPIAAAGFMLLPFVWDTLFGLTNVLVNMGLMAVSIILWCTLATAVAQTRLPVQVVFGSGLAIIVGVRLLGKSLGFIYESSLAQSFLSLAAVALVSIYLLSMVSLLFFRGQRSARGQEAEGEDAQIVVWGGDRYQECCRHIAHEADFTPRELEMLLLLGQGRSVANISSSLFISENTAKSHIRNVYRKLDVHSKQGLIDLINNSLES